MDSTRILYISDMMLKLRKPVMLVGNAGSAKTVILNTLLRGLDEDEWLYEQISFNSFTISFDLQVYIDIYLSIIMFQAPGFGRLPALRCLVTAPFPAAKRTFHATKHAAGTTL